MIKVNIVWNRELLGPRELSVTERFVARGKFASTNQKHYTDLARNTSNQYGETKGEVAKCRLFTQAIVQQDSQLDK